VLVLSNMRAVIQRVTQANVTIGETVRSAIQAGLLVLLAVEDADTAEDIEWPQRQNRTDANFR